MNPLFGLFEGALYPSHILVVLIIGILLFGKRLPELGRTLAKGLVEFKKGLNGLEDDSGTAPVAQGSTAEPVRPPQRIGTVSPAQGAKSSTPPSATP